MGDCVMGVEGLVIHWDSKKPGEPERLIAAAMFEMTTKHFCPHVETEDNLRQRSRRGPDFPPLISRCLAGSDGQVS